MFNVPCVMCQETGSVDTGGQSPWGSFISDSCPYCDGRGHETMQLTAENLKSRSEELVRLVMDRWDEWEAEAGQTSQQYQDPIVGTFALEGHLRTAIHEFLFKPEPYQLPKAVIRDEPTCPHCNRAFPAPSMGCHELINCMCGYRFEAE